MEALFRSQPGMQVSSLVSNKSAAEHVITDGLTLYLDAGNVRSYPGSGGTWTDLAQGLVFSSNGTQTPLQNVGGAQCFTFNGSGYWTHSATPSAVSYGGPYTLIFWVYNTGLAARKTVFEKAGTSYPSYGQEIAVTWETNHVWSYYSRWSDYDYGNFSTLPTNQWAMNAITSTSGLFSGPVRQGYKSLNGSAWASDYTARSTSAVLTAGQIRIGTGYAGTVTNGSIAIVLTYNRHLSADEMLYTFNTFRTRFSV